MHNRESKRKIISGAGNASVFWNTEGVEASTLLHLQRGS